MKSKKSKFIVLAMLVLALFLQGCTVNICYLRTVYSPRGYPFVIVTRCVLLYQSDPPYPYYVQYLPEGSKKR